MKKLLLTCAVVALCAGLCSSVMANPTLSQTPGASTVKGDDDSEFFLKEWLYWLLDDVFGWDRDKGRRRYKSYYSGGEGSKGSGYEPGDDGYGYDYDGGDGGWGGGSGDGGWGGGSGDGGWGGGSGDGGWGGGSGDGGWGGGSGDGGWGGGSGDGGWGGGWGRGDTDVDPTQTIPAPGALLLGGIGTGIVSWLRRRRAL